MSTLYQNGTMADPIIDCAMTEEQAIHSIRQIRPCPLAILSNQSLVTVRYPSFDRLYHQGAMVIHYELAQDIEDLFDLICRINFPVARVVPISRFFWDDKFSMTANNSSGFNYRLIAGKDELSRHAEGLAIDLNPRQNPWTNPGEPNQPPGARYNPAAPGTLNWNSPIVQFLRSRNWDWGGEWEHPVDYQHFQKAP